MRIFLYIIGVLGVLLMSGCKSKSTHIYGLEPVELIRNHESILDPDVLRIWIDGSSSITKIVSIYFGPTITRGTYMEMGKTYKWRPFNKYKEKDHYKHIPVTPLQGWDTFFNQLDALDYYRLWDRPHMESDGRVMHWLMTKYLVEIKKGDIIKRFEFYSYYPSQQFPEDMDKYKAFEKLIRTSFEPLLKNLKHDQEFYNDRFGYEY